MPLYSYHCIACELTFTRFRKVEEREAGVKCPQCEATALYTPTFETQPPVLKGRGFHSTDYNVKEGKGRK